MMKNLRQWSAQRLQAHPDDAWAKQHMAVYERIPLSRPEEAPVLALCHGLYVAAQHFQGIDGLDYLNGPALGDIISSIRMLLNYDIGRLDAATVDSWLLHVAHEIGWNADTDTWEGDAA